MESILTKGVDNNFFFYNNKFINRQLDFEMYSFIDNWRQIKSNSPKKLGFFLEKNNAYIIIYSKVSNFKVYKGGFDNVCWKKKRIKTTK